MAIGTTTQVTPMAIHPDIMSVNREILADLSPIETHVLRSLFGIDSIELGERELADRLGMPVAFVDEVKSRALRKLRHPSRPETLRSFLDLNEEPHDRGSPSIVVAPAIAEIRKVTPELLDRLRRENDDISKLRPEVFEELVAELLASRGFERVSLVGRNNLTSADILAARTINDVGEHIYFIEVKRWRKKIDVNVIDQVHGAYVGERHLHGWSAAMVVSIVGFTKFRKYSREQVHRMGIYLKDRSDLEKWLSEYSPAPGGLWLPKEAPE